MGTGLSEQNVNHWEPVSSRLFMVFRCGGLPIQGTSAQVLGFSWISKPKSPTASCSKRALLAVPPEIGASHLRMEGPLMVGWNLKKGYALEDIEDNMAPENHWVFTRNIIFQSGPRRSPGSGLRTRV